MKRTIIKILLTFLVFFSFSNKNISAQQYDTIIQLVFDCSINGRIDSTIIDIESEKIVYTNNKHEAESYLINWFYNITFKEAERLQKDSLTIFFCIKDENNTCYPLGAWLEFDINDYKLRVTKSVSYDLIFFDDTSTIYNTFTRNDSTAEEKLAKMLAGTEIDSSKFLIKPFIFWIENISFKNRKNETIKLNGIYFLRDLNNRYLTYCPARKYLPINIR